MISFRHLFLLSLTFAFGWGVNASAQNFTLQPLPPVQSQPAIQQRVQQTPVQQQQVQQQPMQTQPIQTLPMGTQGGTSVYQQNPNPNQLQQATQPVTQPANQLNHQFANQPVRVATTHPGLSAGQPASQPISLYDGGTNRMPNTVPLTDPPTAAPNTHGIPPGMRHVGRAEPASQVVPFFLSADEQRELDEFLMRWERYSTTINRYDVNFNLFIYDSTIPGAEPNKPHKVAFGYFKYNAKPRRFVYVVEGEWQESKQVKRNDNTNVHAEKMVIDEKSVYLYDYNAKIVRKINIPPELIGKGIADSPLPLIFGAKADDLKQRFSMRIANVAGRDDLIWLHARPLQIEDQQEFKEIEILLDKRSLTAQGLKQWDINDKAYRAFQLTQPQINPVIPNVMDHIKNWFTADTPRGWRMDEQNYSPSQTSPPPIPAVHQLPIASPPPNDIPLYRVP